MYIPRKLESTLSKYLASPEIIAVVGPRQAGKTTMLRHIFEKVKSQAVFVTFEDRKVLELFMFHTEEFIELYIKPYNYIFIDEFQYAKKGGKLLKYIIDTIPRKLFISGSSSVDLTIQTVKFLVGRIFVFSLFPLDFEEYISYKSANFLPLFKKNKIPLGRYSKTKPVSLSTVLMDDLRKLYQEYILYGGYPRVVTSNTIEEKKLVLKNIYNTYFLREVKDILGLADDYKLSQMIKALSLQIGNLIEYREIGNISELSYQTVKSYLNFLQKTFICSLIKPYFRNKRSEIVKNPKVYFFDTGLRNYIVDDFRNITERTDSGALLENAFVMEFIKKEIPLHFWRNKKGSEIDFIIDLPHNKKIALEIKKRVTPKDIDSKSVRDFKNQYQEIPLIFGTYEKSEVAKDVIFIGTI